MSDSEQEEDGFSSSHHLSDDSSCGYDGAEWLEHVGPDGSLLYIESYVSSTVREKQVLALRTSQEKKTSLLDKALAKADPKMGKLKKENKLLGLLRRRPSIRGKSSDKLSLSLAVSPVTTGEEGGVGQEEGGANKHEGGVNGKRGVASTSRDNQSEDSKPRDTSPAPKVTFRDNKGGEMRTVALHVVSVGDGRGGLCEAVLGVVAGRFSEPPTDRIMVAGILPGSEAHTTHTIKIGDWLKEINRSSVSWENIDAVLGEIRVPSVVTLSLQKCASETLTDQDHRNRKRITQTQLVKHITGHNIQEQSCLSSSSNTTTTTSSSSHGSGVNGGINGGSVSPQPYDLLKGCPPHVTLLLTLTGVTDASPEGSDIKYQFPHGSSRLVRVRGVFLTLAHTLQDITHQHAASTVQLNSEETVHVVYKREDDLVWVLALPHCYCSEHELLCLSERVTDNLCFEFGSLAKSVGTPQHQPYVDHLLGKVFNSVLQHPQHRARLPRSLQPPISLPTTHYLHPNNYLGGSSGALRSSSSSPSPWCGGGVLLWSVLGAPPWLLLQDGGGGAKMEVDNCLSELEAGDFGEEEEDEDCEDSDEGHHNIEGCCLFYKGVVVSSHLPPALLQLAYCQARLHGLLALTATEAVSQLIAWRTVHLPLEQPLLQQDSSSCLLLVAMNHLLIAMILEENQLSHRSPQWRGGPDPFLVEQVEATLFHLHSLHIPALCQDSLSRGGPEVVSADERYQALAPPAKRGGKRGEGDHPPPGTGAPPPPQLPNVPSILKQRPPPEGDELLYCQQGQLVGEEGEDEDDDEDEDDEEEEEDQYQGEGSQWRLWRGAPSSPSLRGSDAGPPAPLNRLPVTAIRVTTGPNPALFHLIHLDVGEGVMIESLPSATASYNQGGAGGGAAAAAGGGAAGGCSSSVLASAGGGGGAAGGAAGGATVDAAGGAAGVAGTAGCSPSSLLHEAVLGHFRAACVHINHLLHSPLFAQLGEGSSGGGVREHGVLFSCSPPASSNALSSSSSSKKRGAPTPFNYWVVGRVVPSSSREVYVCYHESVPQHLQEMAAKLCLGATL